ncbi:transcription factor FapR [Romboutsia maritimum]|uniref:Transcription factor FapR n=1 Tax=Romboutsia maritimum TaxID=2020948 RepID=A0A371IWJ8_9FIRM|nr:transcription factor FapR [Romboutsia maritimum]RDY24856.1 transcription factor FapR [Romboutsia maritimum]
MKKKSKDQRQKELVDILNEDPFYTDEELANLFEVSIQTIRLDRMSLNIPELRERVKSIAETQSSKVKTLGMKEITGEIIDLCVGQLGISMLEISEDMIYSKTNTLRDTYVFSLANSLAMAIIDAPKVIMREVNGKCLKLIEQKDRLIAKAEIYKKEDKKYYVKVVINNRAQENIYIGEFIFEEIE